jgi:hypothetical protein
VGSADFSQWAGQSTAGQRVLYDRDHSGSTHESAFVADTPLIVSFVGERRTK